MHPSAHTSWIENFKGRPTDEVIARISDLTIARAMFDLAVVQYPGKLIMLCQKARILKRSDRASRLPPTTVYLLAQ